MLKLMAARLPAAAKFALAVAVGCAQILEPLLAFVNGVSPRSHVLDAAVAVVVVTLPVIYIMGLVLVYLQLQVTPPAVAPQPGQALTRFADLACALAFALLVAVVALLFLAMAPSSPTGFTRT